MNLQYVGEEPGFDDGEVFHFYNCPGCGGRVCEWMDCPDCGWYDATAWEAAIEARKDGEPPGEWIGMNEPLDLEEWR